jgi:hypothetical protein
MIEGEILISEESFVFEGNVVLNKIYPVCKVVIPEGVGIFTGTKEELIEQGFTFHENYHE